MNTYMYYQRVTGRMLEELKSRKVQVIDPVEKKLACGDFGTGALASPDDIVKQVMKALRDHQNALKSDQANGVPEFKP